MFLDMCHKFKRKDLSEMCEGNFSVNMKVIFVMPSEKRSNSVRKEICLKETADLIFGPTRDKLKYY